MGNSNCWGTTTKKISSDDTPSSLSSPAAAAASNSIMGISTEAAAAVSTSISSSSPYHRRSCEEGDILQSAKVRSFTFSELRASTRNFRPDSVLGEGGFGSVFKGWIDHSTLAPARPGTGMVIAVKKLNQEGFQGHREWLAEVNYLGQLSHPQSCKARRLLPARRAAASCLRVHAARKLGEPSL